MIPKPSYHRRQDVCGDKNPDGPKMLMFDWQLYFWQITLHKNRIAQGIAICKSRVAKTNSYCGFQVSEWNSGWSFVFIVCGPFPQSASEVIRCRAVTWVGTVSLLSQSKEERRGNSWHSWQEEIITLWPKAWKNCPSAKNIDPQLHYRGRVV